MRKHLDEKSLIAVNENRLFYKIKSFFLKLFRGRKSAMNEPQIELVENIEVQSDKRKDTFVESIKNVENEETKLLKLQQQYDERLIETKELPKNQIKSLINLYKKQISELTKSNERRKEKLLQYKKKLQTDN